MAQPTATAPGPASAPFRFVAHPQRTGKHASGALGVETARPQDLDPSRDVRVMNAPGEPLQKLLRARLAATAGHPLATFLSALRP